MPCITTVPQRTIPFQYQQCQTTGRIDALRLQWQPGDEPVPHIFWESDIAKWLEAASYALATQLDALTAAQLGGTRAADAQKLAVQHA